MCLGDSCCCCYMEDTKSSAEASKRHLQSIDASNDMPAQELEEEIAFLSREVMNMEMELLSKYRETFEKTVTSLTPMDGLPLPSGLAQVDSDSDSDSNASPLPPPTNRYGSVCGSQPLSHSGILHRSHSSISQNARTTSSPGQTMHSFHYLPERAQKGSRASFTEHVATVKSTDHARPTPNRLSEEMVKCITAIYCQVAEPPLFYFGLPASRISFSSTSEFPPQFQHDRGPQYMRSSSYNKWFSNPFHTDTSKQLSGSYSAMVEIQGICLDASRLTGVENMLQNFRSLFSQLEKVDPTKLKHEEKLAFWINIHNVLVMHVFLVNRIPRNNLKRNSLVMEAAYTIGGHNITVDMIQSSILGCPMPRPRQWLRSLFFSKSKSKDGEVRKTYGIGSPQPLVKFALTSGSYSDPMVRVYTPKTVLQELEMAKQEYMQTSCKIESERKIFLPKIVESYAKELGLCSADLFQIIAQTSSYYILHKCIKPLQQNDLSKNVEWIPHNFNFRYLFESELATWT